MLRLRRILIASVVLIAVAISAIRYLTYAVVAPASEDYEGYAAFVKSLSVQHGWQIKDIQLVSPTRTLILPTFESWVPAELQPHSPAEIVAPDSLVQFCGNFCGQEFIRKNLTAWPLKPFATDQVRFSYSPKTDLKAGDRAVSVTRIGFDLWHRRAVLEYSVDCSDSSGRIPIMCVEFGDVSLQKISGRWAVKEFNAINL
jgi:hypothetical protein